MTDTPNPRLGDFQPPDRKPRPPRQAVDAEEAAPKTQIPESDAEEAARQKVEFYEEIADGLSPVEDYQQFLKDRNISYDDAEQIVDAIFTRGYYEERVVLTKRLHAVLRTRLHEDTLRLQAALEVQRPVYNHVLEEITARYNMAASLVQYGAEVFAHPVDSTDKEAREESFDVRLRFVERMADPGFYKLSGLLAKFERKVAAVMREGVAENF